MNRHAMTWCFAASLLCTNMVGGATGVLEIGDRKQLLIDKRFVADSENVRLTLNPAQKLGAVIEHSALTYTGHVGNVFEDEGKYRMYHGASTMAGRALALSFSEDAIHWTHPALGVCEINGSRANNVIMLDGDETNPEIGTVFKDDRGSPERRYLMFVTTWHLKDKRDENGIYGYQSSDGIHFTKVRRVLPLVIDNPVNVTWDERVGKYVVFMRAFIPGAENQRQIARFEVEDPLLPWPYNTAAPPNKIGIATPEHLTVVLKADEAADPYSDLYYNNAIVYPWAQDVYLMFVTPFRHFSAGRQPFFRYDKFEKGGDFGLVETQLATSRDGIHWNRHDQSPYFPMGLADEWDRWSSVMGRGMIRRGNYLYQYYTSGGRTHDNGILRPEHDNLVSLKRGIGAVRQRLDGFVSADVDNQGGWLLTPPLVFKGQELRLNIDTGAMGTAFVEIRDTDGKPIPGYTLADAEETGGNYIDQKVYWRGSADVSALAGKPVRLYFRLKRTKLYAFQFTDRAP